MKSKNYESLDEVWDMKQAVLDDFQKSGFKSYVDFIKHEMVEIRKKYNIPNITLRKTEQYELE